MGFYNRKVSHPLVLHRVFFEDFAPKEFQKCSDWLKVFTAKDHFFSKIEIKLFFQGMKHGDKAL